MRLQAAEAKIQAGGNTSGYVKFLFSKEMMPDSFNGADRMKFSDLEFEMSNFLSAGDYEHAGEILEWITQEQEDVDKDKFDQPALQRGWAGQARVHTRFARYLFAVLSNRTDGTPASTGKKRETQRRRERLENATHGVRTSDQCDSAGIHEEVSGDAPGENISRREQRDPVAGGSVKKYKEHRDNKCDNDLKLQSLYDFLPKPIEQWTWRRWETAVATKTTMEDKIWTRQETCWD